MSRHLLDRLASQNKSLDLQGLSTAREPAASGVQPSAITSAIRSQMISSTTAGVGAKAATSKEVHGLKRKVLENQSTFKTQHGRGTLVEESRKPTSTVEPSHHGHTARAASAKRDGAGELDEVEDDMAPPKPRAASSATSKRPPQRKRDPKPGYCENCRDKFDDFEHHIVSRKHRRFATTQSNWDSLDSILSLVQTQQYQNLSQRSFSYDSEDEYCDAN
ncbi:hypothetical protein KEM55_008947 [Ascosphaera atra]|nr:hypothetical protein KEM55_008947 [Ascosphaera atra]